MSDSPSNASGSSAVARLRRRRAESGSEGGAVTQSPSNRSGSAAGMMKMYSEDTPGLKVEPIVVLVLSVIFIASVFVLHIWGKYTRGA